MTLLEAHAPWFSLLPTGTALACRKGPAWLRDLVAGASEGQRRALVLWCPRPGDLREVDSAFALVLLRPRSIATGELQRLGFSDVRRYAALPRLQRPSPDLPLDKRDRGSRWLLPLESGFLGASALHAMYTPYRTSARLGALAARATFRLGLARWSFDEICIAQRAVPTLVRRLEEVARTPVHVGLTATGWGRRATTTLVALDGQGRTQAFAKVAASPLAQDRLRHEARVLGLLATMKAEVALAPRLLFEGTVDGRYLTVQSPLVGQPVGLALGERHHRFLAQLSSGEPHRAGGSRFLASLEERLAARDGRGDLRAALAGIRAVLDPVVIPGTVTHGDFFPPNLRVRDGHIAAFDWEDAAPDGLPLIDLFHHELEVGFLLRDWSVRDAYHGLRSLAAQCSTALGTREVRALLATCLLDSYLRRLEGGHDEKSPTATRYYQLLHLVLAVSPEIGDESQRVRPMAS